MSSLLRRLFNDDPFQFGAVYRHRGSLGEIMVIWNDKSRHIVDIMWIGPDRLDYDIDKVTSEVLLEPEVFERVR